METPVLYYLIHLQLFNKYKDYKYIEIKDFCGQIMGRHFHIKSNYSMLVLQELIQFGMIERINGRQIRILPIDFDIEKNQKKIALKLGIY